MPSFGFYAKLDEECTEEELSETISALSNGKALGKDGIPADIFMENKAVLLPQLHALLLQCWKQGETTTQIAGRQNCYSVSLLSVAGKIFTRVLLKRLQRLAVCILPETVWI